MEQRFSRASPELQNPFHFRLHGSTPVQKIRRLFATINQWFQRKYEKNPPFCMCGWNAVCYHRGCSLCCCFWTSFASPPQFKSCKFGLFRKRFETSNKKNECAFHSVPEKWQHESHSFFLTFIPDESVIINSLYEFQIGLVPGELGSNWPRELFWRVFVRMQPPFSEKLCRAQSQFELFAAQLWRAGA